MAKNVQQIGDSLPNAGTRVGLDRQITIDTTAHSIRVHDGATAGGFETARADGNNIPNSAASTWRNALALSTLALASAHKLNGTIAPTVSNDVTQGYIIGSMWIDTVADKVYLCVDNSTGAALWRDVTNASIDLTPYALNTALTTEVNARTSADTTLQTNINAEVTARQTDTAGRALLNLSNVSNSDFLGKATSAGVGTGAGIQQSPVTYVVSGGTTTINARTILSVNEQSAGQAFDLTYNTRTDYIEQDSVNGTDSVSGTFTLHAQGTAGIDGNTVFLSHFDGTNGSVDITDDRGITPFGTSCAYFDGSAYWTIPSSYKTAFGSNQNFTYEGWLKISTPAPSARAMIFDNRTSLTGTGLLTLNFIGSANKWSVLSNGSEYVESGTSSPIETMLHWAIVRNAGTTTLYIGGVSKLSFADTVSYINAPVRLGTDYAGANTLTGWQDQFRLSNNARYTGTFTPPTSEFTVDSNTVHLFQFNDGHGSQFIRDSSASGHEIRLAGGAVISNAQAKFGSTSLRIDGVNGSYASIADTKTHADFKVGSDDFTLHLWTRLDSAATTQYLFCGGSTWMPAVWVDGTTGQVKVNFSSNNTSWDLANNTVIGTISTATQTHVALSRIGSNIYCFVAGVLGATIAVSTSSVFPSAGTALPYIGRNAAGTQCLAGYVDAFQFERGIGRWNATFTPPASAPTNTPYTIALLNFDGVNGDKVTLDSSEASYSGNVFGDTTTPTLAFQGGASLSATYTTGGNATSLQLNGSSQYASIQYAQPGAGHPLYFAPYEKLCIEFRVNIQTLNNAPIFAITDTSTGVPMCAQVRSDNQFVQLVINGANAAVSSTAAVVGWNTIAIVREPRGWCVYVAGVGGTPASGSTNLVYASLAHNLLLGQCSTYYLSGAIDSVRITHGKPRYEANYTPTTTLTWDADTSFLWVFNGAAGQKWVKELSKNTALIQSTNARTVKDGRYYAPATGAKVSSVWSAFGVGSALFDGTNPGVNLGTSSIWQFAGDFTVECRLKLNAINRYHTIAAKGGAAAAADRAWDFSVTSGNKLQLNVYVGTTIYSATGATSLASGTAYHVACVRSGNSLLVFLNGSLDGSTTMSGTMNTSTLAARIGSFYDGTNDISVASAYIDELRISNSARWTANFTTPTAPYGTVYVTGPYYVTTTNTSQINLTGYSDLTGVTFTQALNPGTSIKYLVSFDSRATWKYWTGSAWAASTLANIDTNGVDYITMTTGLLTWTSSLGTTIDVAASLKTTNTSYTPVLDNLTLTTSKYTQMQPKVDYTVTQNSATGVQVVTFKRLAPGSANHVINYI